MNLVLSFGEVGSPKQTLGVYIQNSLKWDLQIQHAAGKATRALIETLYRENVSFHDRDLIRLTRCHTASENFDAELLLNIHVSF